MNTSAETTSVNHVSIPCPQLTLRGELASPPAPKGVVILLHEAAEGWADCRNWPIAWKLYHNGFATLLVNPFDSDERTIQKARANARLGMPALVERVAAITQWARDLANSESSPLGIFASGVAAAAAIQVASGHASVDSLVCRSARTDLLADVASQLETPILLLAEESDHRSRRWHFEFANSLHCEKKMVTLKPIPHCPIQDATALQSAQLASNWFGDHLRNDMDRFGELVAC
jgi:putative phosphoribosyl transferase